MREDEAVVQASPASSEEYRQARAYALFQEGHYPNPVGHAVVGCESCAEARRLAERLRALPSAGFDAFEPPAFSRENDREEERVHDSRVSDPGAFSRGAGMAPPVAVRQQSELDAAAGMVEQEVASLEDLLPTLFERYAAVMAPADAAEKLMDEPRPSFASPAADRLAHVAARVGSVRAMLASFREAGQA